MQYMINSGFVSWASSVNLAIFALMSVTLDWIHLPHVWMLLFTVGLCGVLFNCYVLLYTNRKLRFLTALKFQPTAKVYKTFIALTACSARFLDTILKKAILELTNLACIGYEFSKSYLHPKRPKESKTSESTLLVDNKVVKVCTPDMTTAQVIKPSKAQSDPLSRNLSIRKKYLPAQSPELFKNKIYITRRKLTSTLHD